MTMIFAQPNLRRALFFVGALLWLSLALPQSHASKWRFSNPYPHGSNIYDMLLDNGSIWQIGERGQIYVSDDIEHWTTIESGTRKSLRGITSFRSQIFISAAEGTILSGA